MLCCSWNNLNILWYFHKFFFVCFMIVFFSIKGFFLVRAEERWTFFVVREIKRKRGRGNEYILIVLNSFKLASKSLFVLLLLLMIMQIWMMMVMMMGRYRRERRTMIIGKAFCAGKIVWYLWCTWAGSYEGWTRTDDRRWWVRWQMSA